MVVCHAPPSCPRGLSKNLEVSFPPSKVAGATSHSEPWNRSPPTKMAHAPVWTYEVHAALMPVYRPPSTASSSDLMSPAGYYTPVGGYGWGDPLSPMTQNFHTPRDPTQNYPIPIAIRLLHPGRLTYLVHL